MSYLPTKLRKCVQAYNTFTFPLAVSRLSAAGRASSSTSASRAVVPLRPVVAPLVCRVGWALHRLSVGTSYTCRFIALLTRDHVKLYDLPVAHAADGLLRVVLDYGRLWRQIQLHQHWVHSELWSGLYIFQFLGVLLNKSRAQQGLVLYNWII